MVHTKSYDYRDALTLVYCDKSNDESLFCHSIVWYLFGDKHSNSTKPRFSIETHSPLNTGNYTFQLESTLQLILGTLFALFNEPIYQWCNNQASFSPHDLWPEQLSSPTPTGENEGVVLQGILLEFVPVTPEGCRGMAPNNISQGCPISPIPIVYFSIKLSLCNWWVFLFFVLFFV